MKSAQARSYRQHARAAAAAATGERILGAFMAMASEQWLDEVTLDEVARASGVTVQTVIRRFGGKDGLIEAAAARIDAEVREERDTPIGDISEAVAALIRDYEESGAITVRMLAQEGRHPALKPLLDRGRAGHRQWVERIFAPWLERLDAQARERRTAQLIVLTDVYAWQLLRRDQGRSAAQTRDIIEEAVRALLGQATEERDGA